MCTLWYCKYVTKSGWSENTPGGVEKVSMRGWIFQVGTWVADPATHSHLLRGKTEASTAQVSVHFIFLIILQQNMLTVQIHFLYTLKMLINYCNRNSTLGAW